jgi:hypothetical protein
MQDKLSRLGTIEPERLIKLFSFRADIIKELVSHHGILGLKGPYSHFLVEKPPFHRDSFGCILHAVSMSMSTSAHRKMHACRGAHVKYDYNKKM